MKTFGLLSVRVWQYYQTDQDSNQHWGNWSPDHYCNYSVRGWKYNKQVWSPRKDVLTFRPDIWWISHFPLLWFCHWSRLQGPGVPLLKPTTIKRILNIYAISYEIDSNQYAYFNLLGAICSCNFPLNPPSWWILRDMPMFVSQSQEPCR